MELRLGLILVLALAGCGDGYTWQKAGPPAEAYSWQWIGPCQPNRDSADCIRAVNNLCTQVDENGKELFLPTMRGCAWYSFTGGLCTVYSKYSESEAKNLMTNGKSHFQHEVGDLANGKPDGSKPYGHCAGNTHPGQLHARGL